MSLIGFYARALLGKIYRGSAITDASKKKLVTADARREHLRAAVIEADTFNARTALVDKDVLREVLKTDIGTGTDEA